MFKSSSISASITIAILWEIGRYKMIDAGFITDMIWKRSFQVWAEAMLKL